MAFLPKILLKIRLYFYILPNISLNIALLEGILSLLKQNQHQSGGKVVARWLHLLPLFVHTANKASEAENVRRIQSERADHQQRTGRS